MSDPQFPPTPPPPPSYNPPPPPLGGGAAPGGVSQNRTLMIALSYIWILFLAPLLMEKEDREVQWHAKHGLVITVGEILFWIVFSVISHFVACIGCFVAPVIGLAFLVVRILCIVKGINGQRFLIPGVSQYADQINL